MYIGATKRKKTKNSADDDFIEVDENKIDDNGEIVNIRNINMNKLPFEGKRLSFKKIIKI